MSEEETPFEKFQKANTQAELDQAKAAIADLYSSITGRYFVSLITDHGMTRQEALTLTSVMIAAQINANKTSDK